MNVANVTKTQELHLNIVRQSMHTVVNDHKYVHHSSDTFLLHEFYIQGSFNTCEPVSVVYIG